MIRMVLVILAAVQVSAAAAEVIPDGTTQTSVSMTPAGRPQVDIAPSDTGGISRNAYGAFSVSGVGVALDNRTVGARLILNEVTSSSRSVIAGPLEVVGTRAHVVLANPNGITLDGASFANVGAVVLGAATARTVPSAATGFADVVLTTTASGDVLVEGAGLTGDMTSLHLLANKLRIDAAVTNNSASANALTALTAGDAELQLDPTVSPLSTFRDIVTRRSATSTAERHDVVVEVTKGGGLASSRVSIDVTTKGAGVSYAGSGLANVGDFVLTADGRVVVGGGQIKAERHIKVASRSIDVSNLPGQQGSLTSQTGAVTLKASMGDVLVSGRISGRVRDTSDADSRGAVTVEALGDVRLLSENAQSLGILFGSGDDLVVRAGRNVLNDSGRFLSNARTSITATGAIRNETSLSSPAEALQVIRSRRSAGGILGLFGVHRRTRAISASFGQSRVPGQVATMAGTSVELNADVVENSGDILSLDGALAIDATTLRNAARLVGEYRFEKTCSLTCWSRGESSAATTGGNISSNGPLSIALTGKLVNSGDIIAYGNAAIVARAVATTANRLPQFAARPPALKNFFAGPLASITLAVDKGRILSAGGSLEIVADAPVVIDGGSVRGDNGTIVPQGTTVVAPASTIVLVPLPPISLVHGLLR